MRASDCLRPSDEQDHRPNGDRLPRHGGSVVLRLEQVVRAHQGRRFHHQGGEDRNVPLWGLESLLGVSEANGLDGTEFGQSAALEGGCAE